MPENEIQVIPLFVNNLQRRINFENQSKSLKKNEEKGF